MTKFFSRSRRAADLSRSRRSRLSRHRGRRAAATATAVAAAAAAAAAAAESLCCFLLHFLKLASLATRPGPGLPILTREADCGA